MSRAARGLAAHRRGGAAEEQAARLYEARGATVLERRWRRREGEIDLIVEENGVLVFVEVKAGRSAAGRDVISARQWSRLEAAALRYIYETEKGDAALRFDAVFITPDGEAALIENAHMSERW